MINCSWVRSVKCREYPIYFSSIRCVIKIIGNCKCLIEICNSFLTERIYKYKRELKKGFKMYALHLHNFY